MIYRIWMVVFWVFWPGLSKGSTCAGLYSYSGQSHSAGGRIKIPNCILLKLFFFWILSAYGPNLLAATCSSVFPTGIASTSNTGTVTIDSATARINNSPSNQITTKNYTNLTSGANVCGAVPCTASNTTSSTATNYTTFPGGSALSTSWGGSLTVSSSANYSSVSIAQNSTLNIAPGDYTVTGDVTLLGDTAIATAPKINVSATGTVRIFVQGNLTLNSYSQVNVGTGGGTTRFIYFYVRGTTTVQTYSAVKAVIYSKGGVILHDNSTLTGALSSEGNIVMHNATVNYSATAVSTTDFGGSCTVAASINNFLIDVGGGTGSNCAASTINITARDSSNAALTTYAGTVTISTSTANGDWAKTATAADAYGTLTAGATDSGAATYVFNTSDAGTISINLTDTHAESLTISLNDSSAGITSTSSALVFSRNAFVVTAPDTLAGDIIAGRTHSLRVTMMKQNTSGATSCSAASDYNVSGVKAWLIRASGDPAGTAPNLINSSNASVALPNAKPASNNVTLGFSGGIANFTLSTSDVGKYAINFADSSNSYSTSEISGASTYVVRPFGFYISVTSNPAASSDTGSVFTTAGTNFTVNVTAKAYSATDDVNSDGVPDNHADTNAANNANLADNTTLIKFGAESPAAETVTLSSSLRLPSGGIDPGLSDGDATANDGRVISSFTNGVGSTTQAYFGEVGIIELAASITDGDYLGAGTTPTTNMVSRSGYVGRFKPYQFAASSVSMTPFCSVSTAFNYLSKDFPAGLTITAQNQQAGTTQNYAGVFAKLTSAGYTFKARDTTSSTTLTSRMQLSGLTGSWVSGQVAASASINLARNSTPDGPYTTTRVGVTISDTDSVSLRSSDITFDSDANGSNDALLFGQTAFYYGRLRLDDAHGPETANLNVSFQTDYWTGSIWTRNRADSCTTIATSAISYPSGAINVVANRTVTVGAGTTIGNYVPVPGATVNFSSGDAGHYFSPPGNGKTGSFLVDVDLTSYAWLRFDWNNDANYSNDTSLPSARYTFGNYRGNDRMLFWQDTSVP
ncbi:MAG TPA: DUF6701 domain-containing protein [Cellvibrionaceae bacterium]